MWEKRDQVNSHANNPLKEKMVAVNKSLNQPSFSYKMWLKIGDGWFLLSFPTLTSVHARHMMVLLSWFRAWRLHCESRNQGKGMLEVPWLAVEPREWFASTRSTFQCRESWFNLRNFQSLPVVSLAADNCFLFKLWPPKINHWKALRNIVDFNQRWEKPRKRNYLFILLMLDEKNQY